MKIQQHKQSTREFFQVTSVCRDDIIHAFTNNPDAQKIARHLDDDDMEILASKLADDYCEQLFWDSLKVIFESSFLRQEKYSAGVIETECPNCKKIIVSGADSSEVQCSECKVIILQRQIFSNALT